MKFVGALRSFGAVLLIATTFFVFVGSGSRWLGYPLVGLFDFAQISFAWLSFIGAAMATFTERHFSFDLAEKLPFNLRQYVGIAWRLVVIVFLVTLIPLGIDLGINNIERTMGYVNFSYTWVTGALPFGAALLAIANIVILVKMILSRSRNN